MPEINLKPILNGLSTTRKRLLQYLELLSHYGRKENHWRRNLNCKNVWQK